jgi:hypothetical protein
MNALTMKMNNPSVSTMNGSDSNVGDRLDDGVERRRRSRPRSKIVQQLAAPADVDSFSARLMPGEDQRGNPQGDTVDTDTNQEVLHAGSLTGRMPCGPDSAATRRGGWSPGDPAYSGCHE